MNQVAVKDLAKVLKRIGNQLEDENLTDEQKQVIAIQTLCRLLVSYWSGLFF